MLILRVENSAKWRVFLVFLHLRRQVAILSRLDQSMNELVSQTLKGGAMEGVVVRIWKPSRFVTQQFAAVQNDRWHPEHNR